MNQEIIRKLIKFRIQRAWGKDHTPKNLAISLSIEASELLENWQWNDRPIDINNVKQEIADVGIYLYYLCYALGIDLEEEMNNKIKINAIKYPIKK